MSRSGEIEDYITSCTYQREAESLDKASLQANAKMENEPKLQFNSERVEDLQKHMGAVKNVGVC